MNEAHNRCRELFGDEQKSPEARFEIPIEATIYGLQEVRQTVRPNCMHPAKRRAQQLGAVKKRRCQTPKAPLGELPQ